MSIYSAYSEDFYINANLSTEMDLPSDRQSVLHFFEQLQKRYPAMLNFYCRDRGEYVLEEGKEKGQYRWASVEARRVSTGHVNPDSAEDALAQHELVMDAIPHMLSASPLDCESLNVMFGFDFTYRGNHNKLVADALGTHPAFERMPEIPGATIMSNEPSIQLAFDDNCRVQCRLSVETRTTAYHVRTGEYPEEQLSVYLTARRYGSLDRGETFVSAIGELVKICRDLADNYVVENILQPLQQAIAIK